MASHHLNLLTSTKNGKSFNVPNVLYENRYCNQDDFSMLVCVGYTNNGGTYEIFNEVYELKDLRY